MRIVTLPCLGLVTVPMPGTMCGTAASPWVPAEAEAEAAA